MNACETMTHLPVSQRKPRARSALAIAVLAASLFASGAWAQPATASWRAGELRVNPATAAAAAQVGLACEGATCQPLQCRWDDAAGSHLLSYAGGGAADYTAPGAQAARLVLERVDACENCRAQYLNLDWRDPARAGAGTLAVRWSGLEFTRGGEGRMGGFANWPNQQPALMRCSAR
jgi:hypothetical protein